MPKTPPKHTQKTPKTPDKVSQSGHIDLDPIDTQMVLREAAREGYNEAISAMYDSALIQRDGTRLSEAAYMPPEMVLENRGWVQIDQLANGYDVRSETRVSITKVARMMSIFNPLCQHAVELFTNFSIGQGVKFNASAQQSRGDAGRSKEVLENFKDNKLNRSVMSYDGQRKTVGKYVVDGEAFLALFFPKGDDGSNCYIRPIDPLEISRVICNPDDRTEVWFYERTTSKKSGGTIKRYYKDWTWDAGAGLNQIAKNYRALDQYYDDLPDTITFESSSDVVVYHMRNGFGDRGVSMLTAAIPWANAHRRFMEARVNVQNAIARYAHKISVKGSSDDIARLKAQQQSGIPTSSDYTENNPASPTGSFFMSNKAVDISPMPQETGAEAAKVDGNMLLVIFGLALGLFGHYVGAGDSFRLATATAMEPPMKKKFLSFQTLWEQAYKEIFLFLFTRCGIQKSKRFIRVDFPEIWQQDMPALIESLARMYQSAPWLTEIDEIVKVTLMHLGIEDPEELWDRVKDKVMKRIEEMNTNRVIGPKGGATSPQTQDDPRTPRPGGKNSAAPKNPSASQSDSLSQMVHVEKRGSKYRIIGPDGSIEKTSKGNPVDGGGHATQEEADAQARAINANAKD